LYGKKSFSSITMARGKGKRGGGRGTGKRFAAQSAEEIEERNTRLADFDAARQKRRADAEKEGEGGGEDDGSVDSAEKEAEREAMLVGRRVADMSVGDGEEEGEWVKKEFKPKGVESLIEVSNPNKSGGTNPRMVKMKDMEGATAAPMTRKEREEKEKEEKAAAYRKRHELGLTEEYKRDMAKLNEVKARRDAAAAKVKEDEDMTKAIEEERRLAAKEANAGREKDDEKKKKKGKSSIPKLDKIAIKKMKPAKLKEELKLRGLEYQGNAKQLTERLLAHETSR